MQHADEGTWYLFMRHDTAWLTDVRLQSKDSSNSSSCLLNDLQPFCSNNLAAEMMQMHRLQPFVPQESPKPSG